MILDIFLPDRIIQNGQQKILKSKAGALPTQTVSPHLQGYTVVQFWQNYINSLAPGRSGTDFKSVIF